MPLFLSHRERGHLFSNPGIFTRGAIVTPLSGGGTDVSPGLLLLNPLCLHLENVFPHLLESLKEFLGIGFISKLNGKGL